jgi:hypothetical protein
MPKLLCRISALFLLIFLFGCAASTQITNTPRSTVEQELLVRALDRAITKLDTGRLAGKSVAVEFYGLTKDRDFAREFSIARLQAQGIRIAADFRMADLRLKIFAPVLGVDRGQAFVGVPTVTVPVLGFTVPEVALFKSVTYHGRAEVQMYTLDGESGEFIAKSSPADGEAAYDQYTILILTNFKHTDLYEQSG